MKQVLAFLDGNKEAKGQALTIILAYTSTAQNRQLFIGQNSCKRILRLLGEDDCDSKHSSDAFSALTNLAQDQVFIAEMIELNASRRIFDFLMKNVKPDQSQNGSAALIVEDQKTEEGGTTKIYSVNAEFASPVQSALMLMTNLTIMENGQKHLLGEGKTKGAIIENIFGMFQYFKTNPTFDFVSNILANVSALKDGRKFLIEQNLLKQILDMTLDKANTREHRRKQLLACIRNCCFEYESYEMDFTQIELLQKLIKLLVQEQGIAQLPDEWNHLHGVATRELFLK